MNLYPELKRMGKKVVIGSYSFGLPDDITGKDVEVVFEDNTEKQKIYAKKLTGGSSGSADYCPEIAICSFLDQEYPSEAPHFMYAYYARYFTVPRLTTLYKKFIEQHNIDAFILFDGGSDSLVVGDESGLGDPIEDSVSVTTVANLPNLKFKVVISIGFGSDRYNDVSDVCSLRAVAEITSLGGFLGCVSLEPKSYGFDFYKRCVDSIYKKQTFRSVATAVVISATEGKYGFEIPDMSGNRVKKGQAYLWPLMGMLWAFDPVVVANRSLISKWIKDAATLKEMFERFTVGRSDLKKQKKIREVENFPSHQLMCGV